MVDATHSLFDEPGYLGEPDTVVLDDVAAAEEVPEEAEEAEDLSLYEIEGHVLLVDPRSVSPAKAMKFIQVAKVLFNEEADEIDQAVTLLELLESHGVRDSEGYQDLYRKKGLKHVLTLAQAWLGEFTGGMH